MDGWISKRIRIVSRRRVIAWSLALIVGVLAATSDHRYLANFVGGPYALTQADLDSIRDVTAAPRYYARVIGNRVLDTGLRQYTVHTQNGVETSREESSAYNALAIGNHFLVVRTAADKIALEGIDAEVIDLRTVKPIDTDIIEESLRKTGRLLVVDTGWQMGGVCAEVGCLRRDRDRHSVPGAVRVAGAAGVARMA